MPDATPLSVHRAADAIAEHDHCVRAHRAWFWRVHDRWHDPARPAPQLDELGTLDRLASAATAAHVAATDAIADLRRSDATLADAMMARWADLLGRPGEG